MKSSPILYMSLVLVLMSTPCFDALTLVHYDVTIHNIGQACDVIMDELEHQNMAQSSSVQTKVQYHVQFGRTFHRGDLEVSKHCQLNWIGIIFIFMMVCIYKEYVDYLWNYQ